MKSNNTKESVLKSEELAKYAKLKRELELQKIEELEMVEEKSREDEQNKISEYFNADCNSDEALYDPNDMDLIFNKWER